MNSRELALAFACTAWLAGCSHAPQRPAPPHAGGHVVLEGIAESRKLGAAVRGDGFDVWIEGLDGWPDGIAGRRVHVTGVLVERYDLPVFIQKPGEPIAQGMPVPEGTDLHAASRREVLRDAHWSVVR